MDNLHLDFQKMMATQLGNELNAFIKSISAGPVQSIRNHSIKKSRIERISSQIPWCDNGYYLNQRPDYTLDPDFHAGAYYVQEASSMYLGYVLKQLGLEKRRNPMILDLCAAPGGKSTHILSILNGSGVLYSNEVIKSRSRVLVENLAKWGYANKVICSNDPSHFADSKLLFDYILIDAPCSGEGMLRKDIKVLQSWSQENIAFCSSRQKRILSSVVNNLKEDGYLIYSTCTFNEEENILNTQWIKDEMNLVPTEISNPSDWQVKEVKYKDVIGYQFYPHLLKGEGFFLSVLKNPNSRELPFSKRNKTRRFTNAPRKLMSKLNSWLHLPGDFNFLLDDFHNVYAVPLPLVIDDQNIDSSLHIINVGIHMGKIKKGILIPSHELALSLHLDPNIPRIHISKMEALQYLKGHSLDSSDASKGWYLMYHNGLSLGWVKSTGTRLNNHYPKNLRIRKQLSP